MAELQTILSSGDITNYQESSVAAGNTLLTSDEIDAKDAVVLASANGYSDTEIAAAFGTPITVSTATYTVLSTDRTLHVTRTAAGTCTITIPSSLILSEYFRLTIKDTGGAGTYNITIETGGSETIDGETDWVINGDYDWLTLYSNGANLFIIG